MTRLKALSSLTVALMTSGCSAFGGSAFEVRTFDTEHQRWQEMGCYSEYRLCIDQYQKAPHLRLEQFR